MPEEIDVKRTGKVTLGAMGDFHIGHIGFQEKSLRSAVEYIRKKRKTDVIIMGDLIEAIVHDDKRYDYRCIDKKYSSIEDQISTAIKILRPIKNKIIGIIDGNHEGKLSKRFQFSICKMIANELGVPAFNESVLINYNIDGKKIQVLALHPHTGAAATPAGQINKALRLVNAINPAPQLTVMGHFHDLNVLSHERFEGSFKSTGTFHVAMTGSFVKGYVPGVSTYASRAVMTPKPIGFYLFDLSKHGVESMMPKRYN